MDYNRQKNQIAAKFVHECQALCAAGVIARRKPDANRLIGKHSSFKGKSLRSILD